MDDLRQAIRGEDCSVHEVHRSSQPDAAEARHLIPPDEGAADRMARLVRTIEGEIIPRLMLAHVPMPWNGPGSNGGNPGPEAVEQLTRLVLENDAAMATYFVEDLVAKGIPLETLYLELLAPTARRLGELWEEDLCDFTDVTVGLCRLHQLVRELSPTFRNGTERKDGGHRALLAPAPGDQHGFGLVMVAEFFRRNGWDVWNGAAPTGDLADMVGQEWFDLIGFSMSCENRLGALATAIRAVRRGSCNVHIIVLVGGRAFVARPELATLVGADATAPTAPEAVARAEEILTRRAARD